MTVYEKNLTIEDPNQLVLTNLPFQPGQQVKITISTETKDRSALVQELQDLFKETQTLPSSQTITEAEIVAEIEVYRRGE